MGSIDRTKTEWRARWRTPEGASRSRNFKRKADAERFLTHIEASKLDPNYVDPAAGRVTLETILDRATSSRTDPLRGHSTTCPGGRGMLTVLGDQRDPSPK